MKQYPCNKHLQQTNKDDQRSGQNKANEKLKKNLRNQRKNVKDLLKH